MKASIIYIMAQKKYRNGNQSLPYHFRMNSMHWAGIYSLHLHYAYKQVFSRLTQVLSDLHRYDHMKLQHDLLPSLT